MRRRYASIVLKADARMSRLEDRNGKPHMNQRIRALLAGMPRAVNPILTVVLSVVMSAALVGTIVFTSQSLQWLTFLGGVLFAGIVALTSQTSKMAWRLARRDAQVQRYKDRLEMQAGAVQAGSSRAAALGAKLDLLLNALPEPIVYVNRDLRCEYHNRAAAQWMELPGTSIDGLAMKAVLDEQSYGSAQSHFMRALEGKSEEYLLQLRDAVGRPTRFKARQLPFPAQNPDGFYLVLVLDDQRPVHAGTGGGAFRGNNAGQAEDALYIQSMTEHLVPSDIDRHKLLRALQENEFMLLAQRMACVKPELAETDCYEVLLRLKEEEQNMLPPGGFIPVAEHFGLMGEIDRWVVRTVVSHCLGQRARSPGCRLPMFSINLSHMSIADPGFALFVRAELQRPGFPARALCFEIDESELLERGQDVRNFVAAVRPKGCHIAVDGFGSGKISFENLKGLHVDYLKFDGNLIQNILRSPADFAKVQAINAVCGKMGLRTVALFVESNDVAEALEKIGVDYLQGFGVARPEPIGACVVLPDPSAVLNGS